MDKLEQELKLLLIEALTLEDISAEQIDSATPLFGEGLGLDSIDALELGVAIRRKYKVKMDAEPAKLRHHFASIANLARFLDGAVASAEDAVWRLERRRRDAKQDFRGTVARCRRRPRPVPRAHVCRSRASRGALDGRGPGRDVGRAHLSARSRAVILVALGAARLVALRFAPAAQPARTFGTGEMLAICVGAIALALLTIWRGSPHALVSHSLPVNSAC